MNILTVKSMFVFKEGEAAQKRKIEIKNYKWCLLGSTTEMASAMWSFFTSQWRKLYFSAECKVSSMEENFTLQVSVFCASKKTEEEFQKWI